MDDRELYATILGLSEPWVVEGVEVSAEDEEVRVVLSLREGAGVSCPECGEQRPGYDRATERRTVRALRGERPTKGGVRFFCHHE